MHHLVIVNIGIVDNCDNELNFERARKYIMEVLIADCKGMLPHLQTSAITTATADAL